MNEEICPELLNGLNAVRGWLLHWYYKPDKGLVKVETISN